MYWEIEPYHNNQADSCIMPAETDADHHAAFEYAKARLEEIWEEAEIGKENDPVKMNLREGFYEDQELLGTP